jgi:hypothetical protein
MLFSRLQPVGGVACDGEDKTPTGVKEVDEEPVSIICKPRLVALRLAGLDHEASWEARNCVAPSPSDRAEGALEKKSGGEALSLACVTCFRPL